MSQLQVTGEAKIRDIQGPVVANDGVVTALDGAASQYVRGDGTLADFPTSSGGGSSVSYYLNSSVSQGTIGGVAYRELSKNPIIGAGTDIAISSNGYVANYITDANDPDVVLVPGGNFNCEFYFSVNNNTGNPTTYAELYKYDGTTFTLLGTSAGVPESINQGTTIAPYYFAIPVATAALSVTDRLAIRIYVNVDGRTVTLHTENGHLCQVVTTLSKGMVSLNNLTDQSQYLATGTSGTNFAIVSSGDTHTFNLPVASATNTGKLSSTDWSTFNGKQPAGNYVTLDTTQTITAEKTFTENPIINGTGTNSAYTILQSAGTNKWRIGNNYAAGVNTFDIFSYDNSSSPLSINSNGAMTLSANVTTTGAQLVQNGFYLSNANAGARAFYTLMYGRDNGISFALRNGTGGAGFIFQSANGYDYTFPAATGTLALTSNLSAYLPLTGGTLTGALSGTSATFSGTVEAPLFFANAGGSLFLQSASDAISIRQNSTSNNLTIKFNRSGVDLWKIQTVPNGANEDFKIFNSQNSTNSLTIASTGAATFNGDIIYNNGGNQNAIITSGAANRGRMYLYDAGTAAIALQAGQDSYFLGANFGIGTSSPSRNLVIQNSSSVVLASLVANPSSIAYLLFGDTDSDTQGRVQYDNAGDFMQLYTNGSERMRITNGGNVGIGTSSPASGRKLTVAGGAQFTGGDNSGASFNIIPAASGQNGADFNLSYYTGTDYGPLTFTLGGSERMRITSGGDLLIGKSSTLWTTAGLQTESNGTNLGVTNIDSSNNIFLRKNNSTGIMIQFWYNSTDVGSITMNTTNTTYNTGASDLTLKKNFENWDENVLSLFKDINALKFNYISQSNDAEKIKGFIAQEMVDKFPEAYPINENGLYSFNPSGMVVYLMKAIQELKAEIEILKNK